MKKLLWLFIGLSINVSSIAMNDTVEKMKNVSQKNEGKTNQIEVLVQNDKSNTETTTLLKQSSQPKQSTNCALYVTKACIVVTLLGLASFSTWYWTSDNEENTIHELRSEITQLQNEINILLSACNGTSPIKWCRAALCGENHMDYTCFE